MFPVKRVEFCCRTKTSKVIYYIDLESKSIYSEIYNSEFEKEVRVQPIPPQPCTLKTLETDKIINYFEPIAKSKEWKEWIVSDGLISVKLGSFEEFSNAIWYSVMKIKKLLKSKKK